QRCDGLAAPAGDQVLIDVLAAEAVGDVDVGEAIPQALGHVHGVGPGHGGVRQVERDVGVVAVDGVPARRVGHDLAVAHTHRVHVLDREEDVGLVLHAGDTAFEVAGVLTLPPEGGVYDDGVRPEGLG